MNSEEPVIPIEGDGHCLFRSFAWSIYGTQEEHVNIRHDVIEYMREHEAELDLMNQQPWDPALGYNSDNRRVNLNNWLDHMQNGRPLATGGRSVVYGDASVCRALAKMFKIDITVESDDFTQTFPGTDSGATVGIKLKHYVQRVHFDAVHTRMHDVIVEHFSKLKSCRQRQQSAVHQVQQESAQRHETGPAKKFVHVPKPKPIQVERIAPMELQLRKAAVQLQHQEPKKAGHAQPSAKETTTKANKQKKPVDENSEGWTKVVARRQHQQPKTAVHAQPSAKETKTKADKQKNPQERCAVVSCKAHSSISIKNACPNFVGCIRVKDNRKSMMTEDLQVCKQHKNLLTCRSSLEKPMEKPRVITVHCIDCQRPMSLTAVLCNDHMRNTTSTQAIIVPCNIKNKNEVQRKGTSPVEMPLLYLCGEKDCKEKGVALQQRKQKRCEVAEKYREKNKAMILQKWKDYHAKNRPILMQKKKEYREEKKPMVLEKWKKYREENKPMVLQKKKEYREENRPMVLQKKKKYREESEADKKYHWKNRNKRLARMNQYYLKNKRRTLVERKQHYYKMLAKKIIKKYERQAQLMMRIKTKLSEDSASTISRSLLHYVKYQLPLLKELETVEAHTTPLAREQMRAKVNAQRTLMGMKRTMKAKYASLAEIRKWLEIEIAQKKLAERVSQPGTSKESSEQLKQLQKATARAEAESIVKNVFDNGEQLVMNKMRSRLNKVNQKANELEEQLKSCQSDCERMAMLTATYGGFHDDKLENQRMTLEQLIRRTYGEPKREEKEKRYVGPCVRSLPHDWQMRLHNVLLSLDEKLSNEEICDRLFEIETCAECLPGYCPLGHNCKSFGLLLYELSHHFENARQMLSAYRRIKTLNEWRQQFWQAVYTVDIGRLRGMTSEESLVQLEVSLETGEEHAPVTYVNRADVTDEQLKTEYAEQLKQFERDIFDIETEECDVCHVLKTPSDTWIVNVKPAVDTGRKQRKCVADNVKITLNIANNPKANKKKHSTDEKVAPDYWNRISRENNLASSNITMCDNCKYDVVQERIPLYSRSNNMAVDDEFPVKDLTVVERQLTSPVMVYQTLIKLPTLLRKLPAKMRTDAVRGSAIYLPMALNATYKRCREDFCGPLRIIVQKLPKEQKKQLVRELVNLKRIKDAVAAFKALGNPHFEGIEIPDNLNEQLESVLTEEEQKKPEEQSGEQDAPATENEEAFLTQTIPSEYEHITVKDTFNLKENEKDIALYQQKRVNSKAIRPNEVKETAAFPYLFPTGRYGYHAPRERMLTEDQFVKHKLHQKRADFRRDMPFIFYQLSQKDNKSIKYGMYAVMKTGGQQMSKHELMSGVDSNDPNIEKRLNMLMQQLTGSPQYWRQRRDDLNAMDEQYGPATFFMTLSCAEYKWPDMAAALKAYNENWKNKSDAAVGMQANLDPFTVVLQFYRRFHAIWNLITAPNGGPLGVVEHFFWRVEMQRRGAPHVHCKIWVKGAPVIGVSSDEDIKAFIKKHVTCALPDEKTSPLMHKLVNSYQMHHTCTASCQRTKKVKGKFYRYCRFGFPRKDSADIVLNDVEKVMRSRKAGISREKLYRLPRLSSEIRVNDYNPAILLLWQANMDIQFVGEVSQQVNYYMTGYTTKSEDVNTVAAWESAKRAFDNKTSQLYSLGRELLRKRELGGPEACIRLDSQHMYGADSSVVYVSTYTKDKRHRRLKDMKTLKEESDTASPFFDNMVDTYYVNRNKQLEDVCLYDMVMNYKFTGDPKGKLKQIGGPKGSMVKRTKPIVVKTPRHTLKEATKEDYYHQLLMLFQPYRQEDELIGEYESYEEAFKAKETDLKATMEQYRRGKSVMNAIEENRLRLAAEESAGPKGQGDTEADDDEQVVAEDLAYNVDEVITNEKLQTMIDSLTADQRIVFNNVTSAIRRSESDPTEALRLFVSGSAGTGKSYLIDCIRQWISVTYGSPSVCLCAPTGMAAYNIKGVTAHRLFNLPVQRGGVATYQPLSSSALKTKREELSKVRLLIVDEVSMISNVTLAMIDQRLCELFPSDTASFGGWNILLLGDLLQLPPVGAGSRGTCGFVFDELNGKHQNAFEGCGLMPLGLWNEFKYVELQTNKRQENDTSWADMLNRLRLGRQTEDDVTLLKTRLLKAEAVDEDGMSRIEICARRFAQQLKNGEPAVCLFPTLAPAEQFNDMMLEEEKVETINIPARDRFPQQTRTKKTKLKTLNKKQSRLAAESAGLETTLKIGPGARVMLRRNLNVNEGQVNGALGTVSRIILNSQSQVETVVVKYDNNPGVEVPTKRVSSDYEVAKGRFATREQFPLILAYGITIHKCQGLSVNIAFVDLGDSVFESAQSYVALSRVRQMNGLHIVNFNERKIMCSNEVLTEYIRLRLMALNKDNLKPLPQKIGKPSVSLRRDKPAAPAEATTRKSTEQLPSPAISRAETETTKQTPSAKPRPADTSTTTTEGTRKSSRVRKRKLSGGKATTSRCQQVDTFGSPTRDPTTIDPQSVFICDGDGNCMFRAISHQLFQDESQHKILRALAVEHFLRNPALFAGTFEADTPQPDCSQPTWDQLERLHLFCTNMSMDGFWGEYRCLVALSAELAVNIIVHTVDSSNNVVAAPYLICHGDENNNNQNVHLRFKQSGENAHYDSITNPKMFTAYGEKLRCGNQATEKDIENDYKAVAPSVNFLLRLRSANKPTTSAVQLLLRLESNPKSPAQRATAIRTPLLPQDAPRTAISRHNTDLPNVIKDTPRTEPQTFVKKIAKKIGQSLLAVKKRLKNTEASPCDRELSEQIRLQRKDAHRAWKTAGAGKKERQRVGQNPHWVEHFANIEREQEVRCLRSRSDSPTLQATESDVPHVLRLRSNHTNAAARMTGVRSPLLIRPKTNTEARYDAERKWRAAELEREIREIQQTDTDPKTSGVRTPLLIRPNRPFDHASTNGNRRAREHRKQNSSTRPVAAPSNKPKTNREARYDAERKRRAAELEEEVWEKQQREKAEQEEREASGRKEDEDKKYMEEQEEQQRERQEREERHYRCEMEQRRQEEEEREVERERERKHYIEVQERARRDDRERQEREDREREEARQRYEEEERQTYEEELRRYIEERQRYEEERRQREDREREEQRERESKHYLEVQEQARRDERERQERDDRERREQEERERIEREERERIEREERERRDEESKRSRRNSGKRSSGR